MANPARFICYLLADLRHSLPSLLQTPHSMESLSLSILGTTIHSFRISATKVRHSVVKITSVRTSDLIGASLSSLFLSISSGNTSELLLLDRGDL